jgi:hypothetical protein
MAEPLPYYSSSRNEELESTHYVLIRQEGQQLFVESLPDSTGSKLNLDLMIDGFTATGSWKEHTSPTGHYKGAVYRGAIQFLIAPTGGQMTGKWIGFGKTFAINNCDWELVLETKSTSKKTVREYSMKQ